MGEEENNRRTINSAIGSWSGYIFQGLCAVYVVLIYLLEELESEEKEREYKDYIFYLDSFDDFSIHRGDNHAISLHQCKVYKTNTGFQAAQQQLLEQKKFLQDKGLCDENTKLYFHANHVIDKIDGVIQYKYVDGETTYGPEQVVEGIRSLVTKIIQTKKIPHPAGRVCDALYRLIDSKVQEIHQRSLESEKNLCDLARMRESAIKFQEVRDIINNDDLENCSENEFWLLTKFTFMNTITELIEENKTPEDWEDIKPDQVLKFADSISRMDEKNFLKLMNRIIPCEGKSVGSSSVMNLANTSIVNELLHVVGKSDTEISSDVDWNKCDMHQTPSAYSQDSIRKICSALYAQRSNLDCLREYDWLVHDKKGLNKIENCWDEIINIIEVDKNDEYNDIFTEKKIGLMNIQDFNSLDND